MDVDSDSDSSADEVDISSAVAKNAAIESTKLRQRYYQTERQTCLPLAESDKMTRARFFTGGVDGRLREWSNTGNGNQSIETFSTDVNGGAIWSLAVSPDQKILAVGCEDGRIRLFSIYERSVEFLRGFEAVEEPFLVEMLKAREFSHSVWNSSGNVLISGSASGALKLWNCSTGRPIHSLKIANLSIWSVAFAPETIQLLSPEIPRASSILGHG